VGRYANITGILPSKRAPQVIAGRAAASVNSLDEAVPMRDDLTPQQHATHLVDDVLFHCDPAQAVQRVREALTEARQAQRARDQALASAECPDPNTMSCGKGSCVACRIASRICAGTDA